MSALKQKMMSVRAIMTRTILMLPSFLPFFLLRHNSHPLSCRFNVRGFALIFAQETTNLRKKEGETLLFRLFVSIIEFFAEEEPKNEHDCAVE